MRYLIVKAYNSPNTYILAKSTCSETLTSLDAQNFNNLLHKAGFMLGMGIPVKYEIKLVEEKDLEKEGSDFCLD